MSSVRRHDREREAQPGERRAQVVGDAGEHLGALDQEAADALLHPVEGGGGLADLGGAFRADGADVAAHAEGLGGGGEAADRAHLVAHEQRGDQEQHAGSAHDPEQEDVDRGGVEALHRDGDVQHALVAVGRGRRRWRVGGPVHGERQAHHSRRAAAKSSSGGADDVLPLGGGQLGAWLQMHLQVELVRASCRAPRRHPGIAVHQFQRVGEFGRDVAGEAAGDDVEVAAVEELEGDGLQQDQRQQDHQQAAAEQRARQHPRARRPKRLPANSCGHSGPGFST